jgi:hypothetical protein
MAINWNLAGYVSPNIEIAPDKLPVEALVKTSDVLQDRYDKSYENYTKAQEYQRQMLSAANEADKEAAQQIFSQYEQQLKDIADRGDYHNMRWETLNLAQEAANNYANVAKKNELIEKRKEEISKSPLYFKTRDRQMQYFMKNLPKLGYDPEKRTLTGLNVPMHDASGDLEGLKLAVGYGSVMKPTSTKGKDYDIIGLSPEGKEISRGQVQNVPGAIFAKKSYSGGITRLTETEIEEALDPALKADATVQAYLNREVKQLYNVDPDSEEGQKLKEQVYKSDVTPAILASAGLLRQYQDSRTADVTPWAGFNAGSGNRKPEGMGVPVNTLADKYGPDNKSFRETLVNGLTGEKGDLHFLSSYLNNKAKEEKDPNKKQLYSSYKQTIQELSKLPQTIQDEIASKFKLFSGSRLIEALDQTSNVGKNAGTYSKEAQDVITKLKEFVSNPLIPGGTDVEVGYNAYNKNTPGFQSINLLVPHYADATTINELQTWIDNSLSTNDFWAVKGKLNPSDKYAFSKVSDRPLGNGTGIVIELKNEKTGETVLVEPKDDRMLGILEKTFPGISSANMYKNTSDFSLNESRNIGEILQENGLPVEQVPQALLQNSIKHVATSKNKSVYQLIDSQGKVIKQSNSYIDLLP